MSTTTPNRRAVATGVDAPELCNNPEHKWDVAMSLVRDFEARIKKFERVITGGTNAVICGDIQGPRQGFSWFVTRIAVAAQPFLTKNSATVVPANLFNADVAFFESSRGALAPAVNALPETPFGGTAPIIGYLQLSNLVSGAWGHIDFGKEEVLIDSGQDIGFFINLSAAQNGQAWMLNGQAIEIPNARVSQWLEGF